MKHLHHNKHSFTLVSTKKLTAHEVVHTADVEELILNVQDNDKRAFLKVLGVAGLGLAATTLFSIVTLPVEYDASNRALAWLENKRMLTQQEQAGAKDALKWAARTYVVAALGSIATLLYYVSIYMGGRRE